MADIFSEIDAELKADRARRLLRRYGGYVLAGVLAVIVVVAMRQGYIYWTDSRRDGLAEQYQRALLSPTIAEDLTPITEARGGYAMLARFAQAAALAEEDSEAAQSVYAQLAADTRLDMMYREAALVLSVIHAGDGADTDTLIGRLETIPASGSAWSAIRTELLVGLALQKGDRELARGYLEEWYDVSSSIQQNAADRLTTLDAMLGGDSDSVN